MLTAGAGIAGLGGTLLEPMIVAAQGPWGSTLGPSRRLPLFDVTAAPYHARGDGSSRVSGALFKNFTLDGAADLQPDAQSMVGISNVWTDRISLLGVRVSRVKGTGAAEGVCFDSYYSTNHAYRDCEAQQIPTM